MLIYLSCFLYILMRTRYFFQVLFTRKTNTITGTRVSKPVIFVPFLTIKYVYLHITYFFFYDWIFRKWTLVVKVVLLDSECSSLLFHWLTLGWLWYKSKPVENNVTPLWLKSFYMESGLHFCWVLYRLFVKGYKSVKRKQKLLR